MPTRKIEEKPEDKLPEPCYSLDHNVPSHQVFPPGLYEHQCSGCKRVIQFRVNGFF